MSATQAIEKIIPSTRTADVDVYVRDKTATKGKKVHRLIDKQENEYRDFVFQDYRTPVAVPLRFATALLDNEGFLVSADEEGQREMKANKEQTDASGSTITLRSDQVIADLDELTVEALQNRVKLKGGKFAKNTKKADLMTFLISEEQTPEAEKPLTASHGTAARGGKVEEGDDGELTGPLERD